MLDNDDGRFISDDDWFVGDPLPARERRWWASLPFRVGLAALGLVLACGLALAQQNRPMNCSQTVGASAEAVPFPASGAVGPSAPKNYLMICNAHASNTLGVNAVGGTAAIGSAGTLTLNPGGCRWWTLGDGEMPAAVSVIGSAGSTTTACDYR